MSTDHALLHEFLRMNQWPTKSIFGTVNEHSIGYGDLLMLEHVLASYRQYRNFVEIGTGSGLTTLYIGIAAQFRGASFVTFDIHPPKYAAHIEELVDIRTLDILMRPGPAIDCIRTPHTLAIFDNGNKTREVAIFAKWLQPGSAFLVHDWGSEIHDIGTAETLFDPMPENEVAEMLQSHYRGFIKKP